jgi:nickel/cobalt transporter (NicO) family protein
MVELILSSLVLGVIHASIPNHWLPLIAIGKAEKWTSRETVAATLITGFSHTLSTIIIGFIVGFVGMKLSDRSEEISHSIAPAILVMLGLIYLTLDYRDHRTHRHHSHIHLDEINVRNKSKIAILTTLSLAMFFSPCIEIEAYYFKAGTHGWSGILVVSLIYTIITVGLMVLLVSIGMKGVRHIKSEFLEHHNRAITGIILILIGIFAYLIE